MSYDRTMWMPVLFESGLNRLSHDLAHTLFLNLYDIESFIVLSLKS